MQLTEYEQKVINRLGELCHEGKLSNECMVQIVKLLSQDFLQLKTIQQYADGLGISYQAARKHKLPIVTLFEKQLFIDNE